VVHSFAGDDPIVCRDYVRENAGLPAFQPRASKPRQPDISIDAMVSAMADAATPQGRVVATYDYTDASGRLLYQVERWEPKNFTQRRPDGRGGWIYKNVFDGINRVPYRWKELAADIAAFPDAPVFITEGEKDCDNTRKLGLTATCVAGGVWTDDISAVLKGRDVLYLEDNDKAGREKSAKAAQALHGVAASVRIARFTDLPEGKNDLSDWIEIDPANHNAEALVDRCRAAPLWNGPSTAETTSSNALDEAKPLIKSSAQFVAGHVPPEYVLVGVLVRRFIYSLTGQTGSGKTCVTLRLAASAALGATFAGRVAKKCRVLYAAAENPEDVRMRWIALAEHMGFDLGTIDVYFTEGTFTISKMAAKLRSEAEALGGEFGLVIIDTGPAFFEGDDENSRTQMGAHARMMRSLINIIPGGPAVIVNCHPVKNAAADNLLPAGGGTLLNEVDGNLTCAKNDSLTELHWQGKFRGPEFTQMHFLIRTVTHRDLKDSDGRLLPTVICEHLTDQAREDIAEAGRKAEDEILALIDANPAATLGKLAQAMNWKLHDGGPNKMRAKRSVDTLKRTKLVEETRSGRYVLTPKGKKELGGEK
jgi:AAA domain